MELTHKQREAFGFIGESTLFTEFMRILETSIEQECLNAIDRGCQGEERIHAAGRADGLVCLKANIQFYRDEALRNSS